jgi:hypothetical protein
MAVVWYGGTITLSSLYSGGFPFVGADSLSGQPISFAFYILLRWIGFFVIGASGPLLLGCWAGGKMWKSKHRLTTSHAVQSSDPVTQNGNDWHSNGLSKPGTSSVGASFSIGCLTIPAALISGPVIGGVLTFLGLFLESVFICVSEGPKEGKMVGFVLCLITGGGGLGLPISLIGAIGGLVIGLYAGLLSGIAGFLVIILTTKWLPTRIRTGVIATTMAVAAAYGARLGHAEALDLAFDSLWAVVGGGLFGLVMGIIASWFIEQRNYQQGSA